MEQFSSSDLKSILHSKRANIYYLEHCRVLVNGGRVEYVTDHLVGRDDELGTRRHGVNLRAAGHFEPVHGIERLGDVGRGDQQTMTAQDHRVDLSQIGDQARALLDIDCGPS